MAMLSMWGVVSQKKNCAKKPRCFVCNSDKHEANSHVCIEGECKDGSAVCPHPPKCVVCSGPHRADSEHCPLKPVNSKVIGPGKRAGGLKVSQVRGQ